MIWKFLGLVDLLAGILILASTRFRLEGSLIILVPLLIVIVKGAWSVQGSISAGMYFNWLGYVDILVSLLLFMIFIGNPLSIPFFLLAIIIFKAIYTNMIMYI